MENVVISNIFKAFSLVSKTEQRSNELLSEKTKQFLTKIAEISLKKSKKDKKNERK